MNWQGPGSSLQQFANSCLDFVFPPMCISCNNHLDDGQERVCRTCWNSIQSVTRRHPLFIDTREKLLAGGFVSDLVSRYVFEKEGAFEHIAHGLKIDFAAAGIDHRAAGSIITHVNAAIDRASIRPGSHVDISGSAAHIAQHAEIGVIGRI